MARAPAAATGSCLARIPSSGRLGGANLWLRRQVLSECADAIIAGVDADAEGGCAAAPGMFLCGPTFCETVTSYCERLVSDVGGSADVYSCLPLPVPCSRSMTCTCLAGVRCGDRCQEFVDGGMTVTCPGG